MITDRQFEIIEAAGRILTEFGVSGLTIKNLAKKMMFSESAIYRHFSSKEKIVITMLEYVATDMDERYTNLLTNELSPEEKFVTLFRNKFSFFDKHPHFMVAVFSDGLMEESEKINQAISKIMSVMVKHLKPILVDGQKCNVVTDTITADNLTHIIMGAVRLQMYKWRVANFEFDIIQEGDKIMQSLLTLIKTKSE